MTSKTIVLITGANQGLGYYAAQQLAATNKYHVLIGSRDISKAEKAIQALSEDSSMAVKTADLEPVQIDVNSDESIQAAAKAVEQKHGRLDILMPNAGITDRVVPGTLRERYQGVYNTNLFGAAVTVEEFLPLLRKSTVPGGKRIAFTSSGLASIGIAATANDIYAASNTQLAVYRSSKTAMIMIMVSYARSLEPEGFVVSASDPGYCATNLNNNSGMKDPRDGAKSLILAAVGEKEKVHGKHVSEEEVLPW